MALLEVKFCFIVRDSGERDEKGMRRDVFSCLQLEPLEEASPLEAASGRLRFRATP